jgi:hypothetical protein
MNHSGISQCFLRALMIITVILPAASPIFPAGIDDREAAPVAGGGRDAHPNPLLAGAYSLLLPGGGYFYDGEYGKGALTAPLLLPMLSYYYITTDTFREKAVKVNATRVSDDLYYYSVFDSYQDACDANPGYEPVLHIRHSTMFET